MSLRTILFQPAPRSSPSTLARAIVVLLLALWSGGAVRSRAAEPSSFDRTVAPLLAARCLDCHSGAEPQGGLDLTTARRVLVGGESGPALVPGMRDESLLWKRVVADEMPPKHPLTAAEKQVLGDWLAAGAKWGTDPLDPFRFTTDRRAGYDWWSLQPLARPAPPTVRDAAWPASPLDAFILARLEDKGLRPSPPADKRTLLRRVTFDLIGLPPTPRELEEFLADDSPEAYDRVVRRLLASPHYGERWARHWLDVAHFGESDGFEYDRMRPNAWPYRDWVIEALNADLPYTDFARLQIAGDVLQPQSPAALIATGFLVGGAHDSLQPKGEIMRAIMRQDELEDIVGLVSQTFLGLTAHCARCHDHKFDPLPQRDYYRLAAALAGVRRGERALAPREVPPALTERLQQAQDRLRALEAAATAAVLRERKQDLSVGAALPQPLARWEFQGNLRDSVGELHGEAHGGAKVVENRLVLDGKQAYVATPPIKQGLTAKTLEAWVRLENLQQRGGAAIAVQSLRGDKFDALVFGEREPGQWLAGSDHFRRTKSLEAPSETEAGEKTVHMAVVWHADGRIEAFRNGQPYGKAYRADGVQEFRAGESQVLLGLRHSPPGGNKHLAGRIERATLYDRALSAEEIAASAGGADFVREAELVARLSAAEQQERAALKQEIPRLSAEAQRLREQKVFAVMPQEPEPTHLLARGNPQEKRERVGAGGLSALAGAQSDFGLAAHAREGEGRRRLAEWIASEDNPLFARAIVNRVWQYHFGRGLVDTPSDLGFSGGAPSHPQLVDWLASELIRGGWRLKELHRQIVTSQTYRQSSRLPEGSQPDPLAVDADNRLLWRFSPRRLEAEAVRDAALAIAGQLNPARGGPSYQDFRPYFYKGSQFYEPIDPEGAEFNRRSIYRMWTRGGKNPLLDTFDCPDPSAATPKRGSTTTPLQALSLWNSSFVLRMSERLAERLAREAGDDPARQAALAFELCYGRPPTPAEADAAVDFARAHGAAALARVLLNSNGFLYVH